ncbi:DUF397 domain-containing protein [Streptomyces varsoviensis]|uniref:DUF397 domain-containing protein n=1 Tax=Streptomyces varsoviensis TaxID=67373 RepID=UPI0033DC57B4
MRDAARNTWLKSSFSGDGGNNCTGIAAAGSTAARRESETPANLISINRAAPRALVLGIKAGNVRAPRP